MQIYDEDSANTVYAEERAYQEWVKDRKKYILNIRDTAKRQAEWNKLFPPYTQDDSYLENEPGVW